ncbi:hypothetical protein ACOME3_000201 [Neoechinorhynchus agilis]
MHLLYSFIAIALVALVRSAPVSQNTKVALRYLDGVRKFNFPFLPTFYSNRLVAWNPCMSMSETTNQFTYQGPLLEDEQRYYSIVMYDPDVYEPNAPNSTVWLHYLGINLNSVTPITVIKDYFAPAPPIGVHHYVQLMVEQKKKLEPFTVNERLNWDFSGFISKQRRVIGGNTFRVAAPGVVCPAVEVGHAVQMTVSLLVALVIAFVSI